MHGAQRIHPLQMSIKLTLLGQLQTMIKCQKRLVCRAICHIAQKNWVVSGKRDSPGLISLVVIKGKVRVTGKCCSLAFIWMVILSDLIRRPRKLEPPLYSVTNSSTGMYISVAFIWRVTLTNFIKTRKIESPCRLHLLHITGQIPVYTSSSYDHLSEPPFELWLKLCNESSLKQLLAWTTASTFGMNQLEFFFF